MDRKTVETRAAASSLYWAFARIGGGVGCYAHNWAWRLRGVLDSLVGGVGPRRGRRHPEDVALHETIDFWRVSAVAPGHRFQLAAEMKLPGRAWLEWEIVDRDDHRELIQTAYFRPRGLFGRLYWYAMLPFHLFIFRQMAERIGRAAETHVPIPD